MSLFFHTSLVYTQEEKISNEVVPDTPDLAELKDKLLYRYKKYLTSEEFDFTKALDELAQSTQDYIKFRTLECKGDFSILTINELGETIRSKKKLSKSEKKLCMLELLNFQRQYVQVVYKIRKMILLREQKKQLDHHEENLASALKELDKMALKYK